MVHLTNSLSAGKNCIHTNRQRNFEDPIDIKTVNRTSRSVENISIRVLEWLYIVYVFVQSCSAYVRFSRCIFLRKFSSTWLSIWHFTVYVVVRTSGFVHKVRKALCALLFARSVRFSYVFAGKTGCLDGK